jgi:Do/DeqQ family serine protease
MNRRFVLVTLALTATAAFLVGLIVAGSFVPATARSASGATEAPPPAAPVAATLPGGPNFADIAERINPAVVNIDATSRGRQPVPPETRPQTPGYPFGPLDGDRRGDPDVPRKGAGSGFLIDQDGYILTNHHVIDRAERITVKLSDGRTMRARLVGTDPVLDIALVKVDAAGPLPFAPLGNSDSLRVGEWVCAIGNPLAYEHTVTVGVVSYIGRKLFDPSLDNYIQTDAAINFGNSGGPLINGHGEVIGINAAISSRASSIGFAVPVNQAAAILPQLKERGRVSRGFIGVALRDVDPDLQRSLRLSTAHGALVQDVNAGSPGDRAGLRAYDLIVAVDGAQVASNDQLIRTVSAHVPGTTVRLNVLRDGRPVLVPIKLAERPGGDEGAAPLPAREAPAPSSASRPRPAIGLTVRDIDPEFRQRYRLGRHLQGVIVSRVEPMSPAFDAEIERGAVVLEINRRPVTSVIDYHRLTEGARAGDVLAFYLYVPDTGRALRAVRIDAP